MYLLSDLFNFDLLGYAQPYLKWVVIFLCLSTVTVLLSYKRGKDKYRLLPSLLAYGLTLAMISDPLFILTGHYKEVDFTEVLGRGYILAILIAHRGNVMGAFRGANWINLTNLFGNKNAYKRKGKDIN